VNYASSAQGFAPQSPEDCEVRFEQRNLIGYPGLLRRIAVLKCLKPGEAKLGPAYMPSSSTAMCRSCIASCIVCYPLQRKTVGRKACRVVTTFAK